MVLTIKGEKYYPLSERIVFGLESMHEHARCMLEGYWQDRGEDPLTPEQEEHWQKLADECNDILYGKVVYRGSRWGYLPGKDYARAKEITEERELLRYQVCIANGMSEADAEACFQ